MAFFRIAAAAAALCLGLLAADKPPAKLVFEAKTGNVTFDHASHLKHASIKNDCAACHPKIFPQKKDPLNFKAAMHKTAETNKTSCGACHTTGGTSFASKGNCTKCHVKATPAAD